MVQASATRLQEQREEIEKERLWADRRDWILHPLALIKYKQY
jgi:hypothetical protein